MNTNGGKLIVRRTGVVPDFGRVWYDPKMMANILGLYYHMTKKHRCTMDTAVENCINVHAPDGVMKFWASKEGLYVWKLATQFNEKVAKLKNNKRMMETGLQNGLSNLVSTVKENRMGFTERPYEEVNRARRMLHILGFPTTENLKNMICMNAIRNCPVTVQDINNAEKIFGPDMAALKGRTMKRRQ
jgi:hypothetical protein